MGRMEWIEELRNLEIEELGEKEIFRDYISEFLGHPQSIFLRSFKVHVFRYPQFRFL